MQMPGKTYGEQIDCLARPLFDALTLTAYALALALQLAGHCRLGVSCLKPREPGQIIAWILVSCLPLAMTVCRQALYGAATQCMVQPAYDITSCSRSRPREESQRSCKVTETRLGRPPGSEGPAHLEI